jgi:hypothetical protein
METTEYSSIVDGMATKHTDNMKEKLWDHSKAQVYN